MAENIPTVYDENSKRMVLVISNEPHDENKKFFIPMKGKDEKEIISKLNCKELNKAKHDMKEEIFDFEKKM